MRSGFRRSTQFNTNLDAMAAAFFGSDTAPFAGRVDGQQYNPRYEPREATRWMPHQGLKECARRRRQTAKIAAKQITEGEP